MNKLLRIYIDNIYLKYAVSILWTLLILYLSLANFRDTDNFLPKIPFKDKLVHFFMYFFYILFISFTYILSNNKVLPLLIIGYCLFFGLFMEILQTYVFIYRSGDYIDFIFNSIGVFAGKIIFDRIKRSINLKHL